MQAWSIMLCFCLMGSGWHLGKVETARGRSRQNWEYKQGPQWRVWRGQPFQHFKSAPTQLIWATPIISLLSRSAESHVHTSFREGKAMNKKHWISHWKNKLPKSSVVFVRVQDVCVCVRGRLRVRLCARKVCVDVAETPWHSACHWYL